MNNKSALNIISDKILVYKAKRGDKEAYGKLYLRYFDAIYRYIFFRVSQNHEEAEDITEIVFFKAWEKFATFDEQAAGFRAWIYTIARNQVIDYYKKEKKQTKLLENHIDDRENPEEKILREHEFEIVLAAVRKLPKDQAEVISLKFIEEMSNKEMSRILGKKENAIRALQFRALKKLQKILKT